MTPPPGLTCHTCRQSLALALTRRSSDGINHTACPKTCADCGTALPATNRSGRCEKCRHKAEQKRYRDRTKTEPKPRPKAVRQHTPRPCTRCAVPTLASDRVCRDCKAVCSREEVAKWAS